jgi:phospholipid-transporting ATPase
MGNWTTLAVGDGTNDVPMIMEANIGVGIQGVEGTQAVRSADYGICQFKHLQRLILIHGRNGYRRISNFICYYFYKNIILVFAEIYFVYLSGFSGQPFFPDFLPIMYNSAWTSWPCIFAYSIECDIVDKTLTNYLKLNNSKNKNDKNNIKISKQNNLLGENFEIIPKLYRAGQLKSYFNLKIFWLWLLYATIHGGLTYLLVTSGVHLQSVSGDGKLIDHWYANTLIFSCIIHIVTFKIFIEIAYWNWLVLGTSVLSVLVYYVSILLVNNPLFAKKVQNELTGKVFDMMLSKTFWLYVLTLPILVLVFDSCLKNVYRFYKPNPVDLVNMGKVQIEVETDDILSKMTQLKPSGDLFNKKSIMNHFLLAQHMQKKPLIELPNKQVIELNINKSDNLVDNFDVNAQIRNNKGGGSEFNGFGDNNNANNENLISVGLSGEYESAQKEHRSKLIINERQ